MFDRASMKLGLDKALLQNGNEADPFDVKGKSSGSLSKQEVEDLLKKGAYGAFMDDGAGDKFCEEDIEQILERRTLVIRHDENSEARKGSMFSKASFQATGSSNTIDVNDPEFWEKVAQQAQLEIVDELPEDSLIVTGTRERKQVTKLDDGEIDEDPSADFSAFRPSDARIWSTTERNKLERAVMQHGFSQFDMIAATFPRRNPDHLKACVRDLMLKCIDIVTIALDVENLNEVKRAIALYFPPPEVESETFNEIPELADILVEDLPWVGADEKEVWFPEFTIRNMNLSLLCGKRLKTTLTTSQKKRKTC